MKKLMVVLVTICCIVTISACGVKEKVNEKAIGSGEISAETTNIESETTVEKETTGSESITEKETTTEVIKTKETTKEASTTKKIVETTNESETTTTEEKKNETELEFKMYRYYLEWNPPAGFVSSDGMIYVTENYPNETSNITYQYIFQSDNLILGQEQEKFYIGFDGQQYERDLETQYNSIYGFLIDINTTKDEMLSVMNGEGRKICMEYMIGETSIKQTQYMYVFNNNKDVFIITYTISNDEDFEDVFEKNANEMKIGALEWEDFGFTMAPLTF